MELAERVQALDTAADELYEAAENLLELVMKEHDDFIEPPWTDSDLVWLREKLNQLSEVRTANS